MDGIKKYVPFFKVSDKADANLYLPSIDGEALTPEEIDERGARAIRQRLDNSPELFALDADITNEIKNDFAARLARAYREEFSKCRQK